MNELTREQILSMDERQLAEATAVHVMGWERVESKHGISFVTDSDNEYAMWLEEWEPAEDITDAWEVETEIDNIGALRAEYVTALKSVLASTGEYVGFFDYIHATPKQRSQAALLAVMGL